MVGPGHRVQETDSQILTCDALKYWYVPSSVLLPGEKQCSVAPSTLGEGVLCCSSGKLLPVTLSQNIISNS